MSWNFTNWYVPLLEGCCHGTNVPVPYEDGMSFLESNEWIITIVNQLIDNNNEIPDIIKEEVKTEFTAFLQSQDGIDLIKSIIPSATTTTEGTVKLINTIPETASPAVNVLPTVDGIRDYVSDKIAALGNVLDFKGVKATVAELPDRGNTVGDVWYVEATKSAWAWVKDSTDPNGRWDEFGPVIDLSPYFKKADIVQTTGTATDKVMSQKASTDNFVNSTNGIVHQKLNIRGGLQILNFQPTDGSNHDLWRMDYYSSNGGFVNIVNQQAGSVILQCNNRRIGKTADPIEPQDVATKAYVDAHSSTYTLPVATADNIGGVKGPVKTTNETEQVHIDAQGKMWVKPGDSSYTLPVATNNDLGGVKAPPKTANDNRQITIDADGYLWVEDIVPYELPVANYTRLGGIKASVDACPIPERRQGICVEPNGLAWVPKLIPATDTILGGIKADESSEAMPVEIAIDPTTHKLKGTLMTAYNSPTTIGGVVSNGLKTDEDIVPVHMDSDGKQWTSIHMPNTISISESKEINLSPYGVIHINNLYGDFKDPIAIFSGKGLRLLKSAETQDSAITKVYSDTHLASKELAAPTAAGQVPKYNGTKVIWEAPAAPAPGSAQTGHIAVPAGGTAVNIADTTYSYCIASIMNNHGNWIKDISHVSNGFHIEVNSAPTTENTCIICYMLFN